VYNVFNQYLARFQSSRSIVRFKVLVATYQIVSAVQYTVQVQFPELFSKMLAAMLIFSLDIFSVFPGGCKFHNYDLFVQLILITISPIILVLLLICISAFEYNYQRSRDSSSSKYNEVWNKYFTYILYLTYLVLPSVSVTIFKMFPCVDIDPYSEDSDAHDLFLKADVSIKCDTTYSYIATIYASVMIIIYPVGIPMMYLWLLYQRKDEIMNRDANVITEVEPAVESDRISHPDSHQHENKDSELLLSDESKSISFLWEAYKAEYWYWEIVECYRRITLTALLIEVPPEVSPILAVLLSLLFMMGYRYLSPYQITQDGIVSQVGQVQIFYTYIAAFCISYYNVSVSSDSAASGKIIYIYSFVRNFNSELSVRWLLL